MMIMASMELPSVVVLQNVSSVETRAIRSSCLLNDIPTANCSFEGLAAYRDELKSGRALPVGSVEFVRSAMAIAGITEPANLSYPEGAQRFLGRRIRKTKAGQVIGTWFVKPLTTKAFTGFVFDTMSSDSSYSEADRESLRIFMAMPADTPVWISEPVTFLSEWRYYVQKGTVVGSARYDPYGEDDAPEPDADIVSQCLLAIGISTPFAADFGVLDNGETILVESNDFWSLGLYGKALEPLKYLSLLQERWCSLVFSRDEATLAR